MTPDITVLSNGLTVTSLTLPRVETVSLGVYVGVGARFEDDVPSGISHFLEHMVFKGSARRSARQLAEAVEDVGGAINAYTARDVTAYYLRLLKADAALGVDILADLIFGARLNEAEVVKERDVILQEIGQVQDTPDDLVFDLLQEVAYPGQPFGTPILGTPGSIAQIDSAALKHFRTTHYGASNLVFSAAGNIAHKDLVDIVEAQFGAIGTGQKYTPRQAAWSPGERSFERPSEQVHLALGYNAPGLEDEQIYAVQAMSTMLGGGMSSRLFQDVREERGLAYSVFADVSAHAGAGLLSLYAGTSPSDAAQALDRIRKNCADMTRADDPRELARAKAQLKAGLAMSLESSAGLSEQMGRQMLAFGYILSPADLIAKVDGVTLEDVRAAASYCFGSGEAFASVGPAY